MKRIMQLLVIFAFIAPFSAAQQQVQPVAGVLTLNLAPGNNSFKVIIGANITSTIFTNPTPGTTATVIFTENSTGGFTVAFGGNITATNCTVVTTANAKTICTFTYDASDNTWTAGGAGGGITSVAAKNSGLAGGTAIYPNGPPYNISFDARPCVGQQVSWVNATSTINCYSGYTTLAGTASVTGNIATIIFTASGQPFNPTLQGWQVGDTLVVSGYSGADTIYNGTFAITALTNNSFATNSVSYSLTHANASSTTGGNVNNTSRGPFTTADTGKKGQGVNCNSGVLSCQNSTPTMPIGTLTFVNSTTVTTTATSTATCQNAANCQFWWFTDDRSKWCCGTGTVDGAMQTASDCAAIYLPAGVSPIPLGLFNTSSPECGQNSSTGTLIDTDAGNFLFGIGQGVSKLLIPSDEVTTMATKCTGTANGSGATCIGAGLMGGSHFTITGGGYGSTGTHSFCLFCPNSQADFWHDISLVQFGSGDSGALVGMVIPFSNKNDALYVDQFGRDGCALNSSGNPVFLTNSFCGDGAGIPISCINGTICRTQNVYGGSTAGTIGRWVGRGGVGTTTWYMDNDQDYGGVNGGGPQIYIDAGGTLYNNNWTNGSGGTYGIQLTATGKLYLSNSTTQGSSHCIGTNGVTLTTGFVYDQGGNSCVGSNIESTVQPTCTTNCGTGPVVTGFNNSFVVTIGTAPPVASTFTVTFAGTWPKAPSCNAVRGTTGTSPVVTSIVTTPTTAAVTLSANLVASEKYNFTCTQASF